ncbi:NADPH-dependent FMN reductase [Methylogaea oryzae]|uniref:NADPH-dependent FMN reductase n=1 Tax=Methylogaea oryzae TaxID=1295382 RepID=UPI0009EA11C6|nr:NAD(P)H-dependent oxidoreductase [Methylogaea oryzae]
MASKRILIMPGSQRRHSYNRRLAENVGELLKPDFDVDFLDPRLVEIPLFNQDLETDDDALRPVKALYRRFCLADGFVVLTPEYNGSFTPYLKNTVDWVSRLPHIPAPQSAPIRFSVSRYCWAAPPAAGAGACWGCKARAIYSPTWAVGSGRNSCPSFMPSTPGAKTAG